MILHLWLCLQDDFKCFSKYRWSLLNSHSILRNFEKWVHWVMVYLNFEFYLLKYRQTSTCLTSLGWSLLIKLYTWNKGLFSWTVECWISLSLQNANYIILMNYTLCCQWSKFGVCQYTADIPMATVRFLIYIEHLVELFSY